MSKQAVSVTLDEENLLWLRARMRALRRRSLSDTLDQLVREARDLQGRGGATRQSVAGTITIDDSDPDLAGADAAIRALFALSLDAAGGASLRSASGNARRGRTTKGPAGRA